MSKETNNEKLFTPPKSPQKSDVERPARDNEKKTTITIEDLIKQFVDNFSLLHSK